MRFSNKKADAYKVREIARFLHKMKSASITDERSLDIFLRNCKFWRKKSYQNRRQLLLNFYESHKPDVVEKLQQMGPTNSHELTEHNFSNSVAETDTHPNDKPASEIISSSRGRGITNKRERELQANATGSAATVDKKMSKSFRRLYCFCHRPWKRGDLMVGCDVCKQWFHPECIFQSDDLDLLVNGNWESIPLVCEGTIVASHPKTHTGSGHFCCMQYGKARSRDVALSCNIISAETRKLCDVGVREDQSYPCEKHEKILNVIPGVTKSLNVDIQDSAVKTVQRPHKRTGARNVIDLSSQPQEELYPSNNDSNLDDTTDHPQKKNEQEQTSHTIRIGHDEITWLNKDDKEEIENNHPSVEREINVVHPDSEINENLLLCTNHENTNNCAEYGNYEDDRSDDNDDDGSLHPLVTNTVNASEREIEHNSAFNITRDVWENLLSGGRNQFGNNDYKELILWHVLSLYDECVPMFRNHYLNRGNVKKTSSPDKGKVNLYCAHKICCGCEVLFFVVISKLKLLLLACKNT